LQKQVAILKAHVTSQDRDIEKLGEDVVDTQEKLDAANEENVKLKKKLAEENKARLTAQEESAMYYSIAFDSDEDEEPSATTTTAATTVKDTFIEKNDEMAIDFVMEEDVVDLSKFEHGKHVTEHDGTCSAYKKSGYSRCRLGLPGSPCKFGLHPLKPKETAGVMYGVKVKEPELVTKK